MTQEEHVSPELGDGYSAGSLTDCSRAGSSATEHPVRLHQGRTSAGQRHSLVPQIFSTWLPEVVAFCVGQDVKKERMGSLA